MFIAGALAASLTSMITESKYTIAIVSTLFGYVGLYSVFCPLQARDNPKLYRDKKGFRWKIFLKDQFKIITGFAILDIAYLFGKPILVKYFLDSAISPALSSVYSDLIFYAVLAVATWPIAKLSGALRKK